MALILGRHPSETVVISTPAVEQIRVTVLVVRGLKTSLRIDCTVPLNVKCVETLMLHQTLFITTPSGERIEVFVLSIKPSHVELGFNAAQDVAVDREEIYRRKQAEKKANAA